jgi:transcriptional regulator with XRE-family HTH domain
MSIGSNLRTQRRAHGLTLAQVADRTGYSGPYISYIENGKSQGSIDVLRQLCGVYGCSLDSLFVREVQAMELDDYKREQAISGCRIADIVDDYEFAIGQAGNLGGVELA